MKPLDKLNYIERAKLLAELFPGEIRGAVLSIEKWAQFITNNKGEAMREQFGSNPIVSYDLWVSLAEEVKHKITKYRMKEGVKPGLFADQLFDGYIAMFSADALSRYISRGVTKGTKFATAVELLFLTN